MQPFLFFFLIDTHWHCCAFFLPFLHLFFLPVAWPIDLAVQGCKYHCGFFHSRPSLVSLFFTSIYVRVHSLTSCLSTLRELAEVSSCWGLQLHERFHSHVALHVAFHPRCVQYDVAHLSRVQRCQMSVMAWRPSARQHQYQGCFKNS